MRKSFDIRPSARIRRFPVTAPRKPRLPENPGEAIKVVVEFLAPAAVAVIASGFARQLGEGIARIRAAHRSKGIDGPGASSDPDKAKETEVEFLLRQEDGSYKVAAEGVVNSSTVGEIINEIADNGEG